MFPVSIAFASGHSFERLCRFSRSMGCFRVSIPFASGHSFEHSITSAQSAINIKSQSPSHRGTHSNPTIQTNFVVPVGNTELSQSPSHRGTHSNGMDLSTTPPWDDLGVS